jgi:hypothetical protein
MGKGVVMEEFHLTVLAPRGLPESEYDAICRALADPAFEARLRRVVRRVFRRETPLVKVKVRVGR